MEKTSKSIPVTIVTGLLGSGKTSLIRHLLAHQPKTQTWALLINEFGDIGIDAATLHSNPNLIQEVSGGCICCNAQYGYQQAIQTLLKQADKIDRILIEPTGLGHPAKVLDTLNQFRPHIHIAGVLAVVTPMQFQHWEKSAVLRDLVTLADTLILSQMDRANQTDVEQTQQQLTQLYPPKEQIIESQLLAPEKAHFQAQKPPGLVVSEADLLDYKQQNRPFSLLQSQHLNDADISQTLADSSLEHCLQLQIQTGTTCSIGWRFDKKILFQRNPLKTFFDKLPKESSLIRAKGIVKTGNEWQLINWQDGQLTLDDIAWRQDSRLELLFDGDMPCYQTLEKQLSDCFMIREQDSFPH